MQAVVLAAGEGQRMRPLTYTRPKVMLPVANKPILEHLLQNLKKAGVYDIILVVGYRDDVVRDYFGDGGWIGVNIRYTTQRRQLGTADALKAAQHLITEDFLMLNGDNIVGWEEMEKLAKIEGNALAVKEVPNPHDFGVVKVEGDMVKEIIEKPDIPISNLINAGIYKLTPSFLSFLDKTPVSKRGEYEITDTIQLAVKTGLEFKAVRIERWIDVGYPWDLLKANEQILLNQESRIEEGVEIEEGAVIKGNVAVGEGTVIRSGSYIVGPVVIGKNCVIGPNSFIRPYTAIGDNCHVGAFVEVKNSIVMRNTNLPHLNYVGDSIIGESCNFGAGTKIANLRLDEREIKTVVKGKRISTGRRKFGAVIGDNVKTGINASINVGAMVGCNTFISPASLVDGYIEPNSIV